MKCKLLAVLAVGINCVYATNLSGQYLCNGYDTKDGAYTNDYVTLSQVKEHSYPNKDLYSYNFVLKGEKGVLEYTGFATSNGKNIAIYFENVNKVDPKTKEDKGVGIARVSNNVIRNKSGKFEQSITFSKFYFEPTYPSDGSEVCKKL